MTTSLRAWVVVLASTCLLSPGRATPPPADDPIDSPMYRDPEIPMPRVVTTFDPRLKDLWLQALARPEADLKCQAAQTIATARERGMTGLDAAVEPLVRELGRTDAHPTVVAAAARALVALDARTAVEPLFKAAASGDNDLRELVEPALARWDYPPARAAWLDRLAQPPPYRRGAVLAIRGLAAVKEAKAVSRLRELVLTRDVPPPVRLEAARALAVIRPAGSEADTKALTADTTPAGRTDRLAAASLLRQHSGDEAVKLLQALARDAEPTVAAVALARLVEIDPALALPALDPTLASPDANVRSFGVEVLFRRPTNDRARLLADRLSDPHRDVRSQARRAMRELAARDDLRPAVLREGERALGGGDWRGREQAAVLLAQLDHKPAARRLVTLLNDARPEVFVAAAWGLRRLAVPDTVPDAFEYVRARQKTPLAGRVSDPTGALDIQLCQLIQFLGAARHRPADAVLRTFLPPGTQHGVETRAAAAWAVGLFHEGEPVPELARVLAGRVNAVRPFDVEDPRVRRMSAVALGRMKAKDALPILREFYREKKPSLDVVGNACGWAIERITGEVVPPPGTVEVTQQGWFLAPATAPDAPPAGGGPPFK
jgi:HEAT repeat protein